MMNSKQPRKQRKVLYNLPKHMRRKQMSAPLSKKLKEEHKKNSFPLVKDDKIKIMKGKYRGKEGKIKRVNLSRYTVSVEGITVKKPNGKEEFISIQPSNVMITELNLKDEKRKKSLQRK